MLSLTALDDMNNHGRRHFGEIRAVVHNDVSERAPPRYICPYGAGCRYHAGRFNIQGADWQKGLLNSTGARCSPVAVVAGDTIYTGSCV